MCVFCDIIEKKATAHIVYEDDMVVSVLDIEPINEGHVLILPKQHADTIDKLSDDMLLAVMRTAKKIVPALNDIYGNEGYSMMQNGGKFCDFGHAHFHVFPRYDNDGFGWTYGSGQKDVSETIAKRLKEKM